MGEEDATDVSFGDVSGVDGQDPGGGRAAREEVAPGSRCREAAPPPATRPPSSSSFLLTDLGFRTFSDFFILFHTVQCCCSYFSMRFHTCSYFLEPSLLNFLDLSSSFVFDSSHSNPRLLRSSCEGSKFPGSLEKKKRNRNSMEQLVSASASTATCADNHQQLFVHGTNWDEAHRTDSRLVVRQRSLVTCRPVLLACEGNAPEAGGYAWHTRRTPGLNSPAAKLPLGKSFQPGCASAGMPLSAVAMLCYAGTSKSASLCMVAR